MRHLALVSLLLVSAAFAADDDEVQRYGTVIPVLHVDAGTTPDPASFFGGLVYDTLLNKLRVSDGGEWTLVTSPGTPMFDMDALTLGAACDCADVTGIIFTRGSVGFCSKVSQTIYANGDLVSCATNKPRIMPGGDGTGDLGILVEIAQTNTTHYSEDFNSSKWTKVQNGPGLPVVSGIDGTVAPDGTTSAETITWPAVLGSSKWSLVRQGLASYAPGALCYFVKLASGGPDLWINDGAASHPALNVLPTASWRWQCVTGQASAVQADIGGNTAVAAEGAWAMDAGIVAYVWGGHTSANPGGTTASVAWPTYIKTSDAGSITRSADQATVAFAGHDAGSLGFRVTYVAPSAFTTAATVAQFYVDANNWSGGFVTTTHASSSTFTCEWLIAGVTHAVVSTATMTAGASNVVECYYDNATKQRGACVGGTCTVGNDGGLSLPAGDSTLYIGGRQVGNQANGVIKNLCVASTLSACALP